VVFSTGEEFVSLHASYGSSHDDIGYITVTFDAARELTASGTRIALLGVEIYLSSGFPEKENQP
jgi:hypothetical protein